MTTFARSSCLLLSFVASCNGGARTTQTMLVSSGTYDFVFSNLLIDSNDVTPAAGWNFDGLFTSQGASTGCGIADRSSDVDLDQNQAGCSPSAGCQGGVDNALPKLADLLDEGQYHPVGDVKEELRSNLSAALATGRIVYLLRLSGVGDWGADPDVTVAIYAGYSADTSCSALFGGNGQFLADNAWLQTSGNLDTPLLHATGAIVDGRLRATFPQLSVQAAPSWLGGVLELMKFGVTFDIEGSWGTQGNLGAIADGNSTLALLSGLIPRLGTAFNMLLPDIADIPEADGFCPYVFANPHDLGIGIRFGLARANITGTTSTRPSGTCGNQGAGF